jgi:hypothetical protein
MEESTSSAPTRRAAAATVTRRPDLVAVRASWRRMPRLMQQAVDLSPVPAKEILCAGRPRKINLLTQLESGA